MPEETIAKTRESKETIGKTIVVALGVCVVCSVFVSTAAVCLRDRQTANRDFDRKMNIVMAAGLLPPGEKGDVNELFGQIETRVIQVDTGEYVDMDPNQLEPRKAAKDPAQSIPLPPKEDLAGLKRRAKYRKVYLFQKDGRLQRVIFPVQGKGLWSTLYGFIALDKDLNTIESLSFYEQGETPGLGGEVDNPNWKKKWIGKKAFDAHGEPQIKLVMGGANPNSDHEVDGLSGATLTTRGVQNLVRFWLGDGGYGPFLKKLRDRQQSAISGQPSATGGQQPAISGRPSTISRQLSAFITHPSSFILRQGADHG